MGGKGLNRECGSGKGLKIEGNEFLTGKNRLYYMMLFTNKAVAVRG